MNRDGIDNFVSVTVTIHEGRPQERDLIGAPPLGMGEGGGNIPILQEPVFHNDATTATRYQQSRKNRDDLQSGQFHLSCFNFPVSDRSSQ